MTDVLVLSALLFAAGNCLRSNQGRMFILPFIDTGDPPDLTIMTDKPTTVVIKARNMHISRALGAKTTHVETLDTNVIGYDGAVDMSVQAKAVTVTADEDIWLYVFLSFKGGFMAIPLKHLSVEYVAISYREDLQSESYNFVVVAAVEDNTTISVFVKTEANVFCESVNASNGDISVVTLNRNDVVGFICNKDITGTRVLSSKAIVVVSGRMCSDFYTDCSLMIEMMTPTESFGTRFILSAPEFGYGATYKIVSSKAPTAVMTNTGTTYIEEDMSFIEIDVSVSTSLMIVETSNPCAVVVFPKIMSLWTSEIFDCDMSILPSSDRYLTWYVIEEASYQSAFVNTDYVSILEDVDCSVTNGLQCDGFQMTIQIQNSAGMNSVINMTTPRGIILHRKDEFILTDAIASFPLGMLFDTDDCSSSPCYNNATCEDGSYSFVCHCLPGFNGTLCDVDIDECLSSQCQNNGTCQDEINGFICQCKPGFSGQLCENDIDECLSNPCQNNATCQDEINGFVCLCKAGFSGSVCDIDIDDCLGSPCQNNATCQDEINGFVCQCKPGFNGTLCDIDIDECLSSQCQNNGTCEDEINGFICQCKPGFSGQLCENDIDECLSNPCQNNATCQDDINGFVCLCKAGFSGSVCDIDIDDCLGSPCQNNATCQDEINGFVCQCKPGFNGTLCDIDIDECLSSQCHNNGTCEDEINGFICQCKPGFSGQLCENDIDECLSNPCQNNATCQDDINGFVCLCKAGFSGSVCDIDIDDCLGSPCQNNATCQDEINGFVCQCKPGFNGTLCDIDIVSCATNPCENNATCQDEINGFVCQCEKGFSGILCETDIGECASNPCENNGTCENKPGGFGCFCDTGFYGTMCENVGYDYTFIRLISVDKTLVTSTGLTVTDSPLETNIRYETSYTTPLIIQNTPGNSGHSEYECLCTRYGNTSEEEVDQKVLVNRIQEDLLLNKDKLIKTILKYNSMEDDRPSAKGIGGVGCMIIIVSMLVIVVPDIFYVLREFDKPEKRVKSV